MSVPGYLPVVPHDHQSPRPAPTHTARLGTYAVTGWPPVEMVMELCWLMDRPKDTHREEWEKKKRAATRAARRNKQ